MKLHRGTHFHIDYSFGRENDGAITSTVAYVFCFVRIKTFSHFFASFCRGQMPIQAKPLFELSWHSRWCARNLRHLNQAWHEIDAGYLKKYLIMQVMAVCSRLLDNYYLPSRRFQFCFVKLLHILCWRSGRGFQDSILFWNLAMEWTSPLPSLFV